MVFMPCKVLNLQNCKSYRGASSALTHFKPGIDRIAIRLQWKGCRQTETNDYPHSTSIGQVHW